MFFISWQWFHDVLIDSSDDLLLVAKCFMSNGDYNRTRILLENSPMYNVNIRYIFIRRIFWTIFSLDRSSIQISCCTLSCKQNILYLNYEIVFLFSFIWKIIKQQQMFLKFLKNYLMLINNHNKEYHLKHHLHLKQQIWNFLIQYELFSLDWRFDLIRLFLFSFVHPSIYYVEKSLKFLVPYNKQWNSTKKLFVSMFSVSKHMKN